MAISHFGPAKEQPRNADKDIHAVFSVFPALHSALSSSSQIIFSCRVDLSG